MEQERQKEQDRLLKLKGQNQTMTIELESLSTKVKELSQKICDTRVAVTNVKTVIDGMRTTRDTCVTDQTQYKAKIKEQNAKLVQLSQDKSRMDAKAKANATADDQAMFTNKQVRCLNQYPLKVWLRVYQFLTQSSITCINFQFPSR